MGEIAAKEAYRAYQFEAQQLPPGPLSVERLRKRVDLGPLYYWGRLANRPPRAYNPAQA